MAGIPILSDVPEEFTAGDTVKWAKSFSDYPFSDGWIITYYFANATEDFEIAGAEYQTNDHLFNLIRSLTTGKTAGQFNYEAYAILSGERARVDWGKIQLLADFSGGDPVDSRSLVKKTLDALDALLLNKASRDQLDVEIVGRKIKKMSPDELLKWRSLYKSEYKSECDADKVAKGEGSGRTVQTRFIR